MVLKLYGSPLSGPARRVALVLKEKEVPYEFVHVDLQKGEHKTPEYLKKQPFGQVPCIVCGLLHFLEPLTDQCVIISGRRWFHPIREPCHLSLYRCEIP